MCNCLDNLCSNDGIFFILIALLVINHCNCADSGRGNGCC